MGETQVSDELRPVVSIAAGVVLGLAAALIRWSAWWPHRDMRQWWANGATAALGFVGVVLLSIVARKVSRNRLPVVALVLVVAALAAGLLGYDWLIDATIEDR